MKKKEPLSALYVLLFFSVFIRVFLFILFPLDQWWDSGVYVGMGKFLFSFGAKGLWEHIRPPLLSFFLGLFWFLGFDAVFATFIVELFFSLGCIILSYFIARNVFNNKIAFLSSAFLSFSPIFFFLGFQAYSEIPALFFVLFAFFLLMKNYFFSSGFFLGLAFLTRFPAGLFLFLFISHAIFSKQIQSSIKLALGFTLSSSPFFIANYFIFHNPLHSLIEANIVINQVLGCNVLNVKSGYYYISALFLNENFLNVFFITGFVVALFNFKKFSLIILSFSFPFIYFTSLNCKDYRYVVIFLPFFLFFVAFGLGEFAKKIKYFSVILMTGYLCISLFLSLSFYFNNLHGDVNLNYISFLKNQEITGEIWTSNPLLAFHTDAGLNKIYYPVYNTQIAYDFYSYLLENQSKIEYVFLDNCGGGIICPPNEELCKNKSNQITELLNDDFILVFNQSKGICWHKIYKSYI